MMNHQFNTASERLFARVQELREEKKRLEAQRDKTYTRLESLTNNIEKKEQILETARKRQNDVTSNLIKNKEKRTQFSTQLQQTQSQSSSKKRIIQEKKSKLSQISKIKEDKKVEFSQHKKKQNQLRQAKNSKTEQAQSLAHKREQLSNQKNAQPKKKLIDSTIVNERKTEQTTRVLQKAQISAFTQSGNDTQALVYAFNLVNWEAQRTFLEKNDRGNDVRIVKAQELRQAKAFANYCNLQNKQIHALDMRDDNADIDDMTADIDLHEKIDEEIHETSHEIDEAMTDVHHLDAEINLEEEECLELDSTIHELDQGYENLERDVQHDENEILTLQSDIHHFEREFNSLDDTCSSMQEDLREIDGEMQREEAAYHEIIDQHEEVQKDVEQVENDLAQVEQDILEAEYEAEQALLDEEQANLEEEAQAEDESDYQENISVQQEVDTEVSDIEVLDNDSTTEFNKDLEEQAEREALEEMMRERDTDGSEEGDEHQPEETVSNPDEVSTNELDEDLEAQAEREALEEMMRETADSEKTDPPQSEVTASNPEASTHKLGETDEDLEALAEEEALEEMRRERDMAVAEEKVEPAIAEVTPNPDSSGEQPETLTVPKASENIKQEPEVPEKEPSPIDATDLEVSVAAENTAVKHEEVASSEQTTSLHADPVEPEEERHISAVESPASNATIERENDLNKDDLNPQDHSNTVMMDENQKSIAEKESVDTPISKNHSSFFNTPPSSSQPLSATDEAISTSFVENENAIGEQADSHVDQINPNVTSHTVESSPPAVTDQPTIVEEASFHEDESNIGEQPESLVDQIESVTNRYETQTVTQSADKTEIPETKLQETFVEVENNSKEDVSNHEDDFNSETRLEKLERLTSPVTQIEESPHTTESELSAFSFFNKNNIDVPVTPQIDNEEETNGNILDDAKQFALNTLPKVEDLKKNIQDFKADTLAAYRGLRHFGYDVGSTVVDTVLAPNNLTELIYNGPKMSELEQDFDQEGPAEHTHNILTNYAN